MHISYVWNAEEIQDLILTEAGVEGKFLKCYRFLI